MLNFKVNNFITLKLENHETIIYVNSKRFNQCKFLMLNISYDRITAFNDIESIDEVASKLDKSLENKELKIPPEVEFWGHCSNLQVWAENNYNTRLLHSNIAFPLLKKLTEVGDSIAKRVFGEEIAKRYESGYLPVIRYLLLGRYLLHLPDEYLLDISRKKDSKFVKLLFELLEYNAFEDRQFLHNYNKELALKYFSKIISVIDEKSLQKLIDKIKKDKVYLKELTTEIYKKNIKIHPIISILIMDLMNLTSIEPHHYLALLKSLKYIADKGNLNAGEFLKKEIVKRIKTNNIFIIYSLIHDNLLKILDRDTLSPLLFSSDLIRIMKEKFSHVFLFSIILSLNELGYLKAKDIFNQYIIKFEKKDDPNIFGSIVESIQRSKDEFRSLLKPEIKETEILDNLVLSDRQNLRLNLNNFKILENLLLFSESPFVKYRATELLIQYFPIEAKLLINYAIHNNKSIYYFKNIIKFLESKDNQYSNEMLKEVSKRLGFIYDLYPDDAKFFFKWHYPLWNPRIKEIEYNREDRARFNFQIYPDRIEKAPYSVRNGHITGIALYGSMPELIGSLKKLKYLYIHSYNIKELPKSMANLYELRTLHIDGCNIKSLPNFLASLPKLKRLALISAELTEIPDWVYNLANQKHYTQKYIKEGVIPYEAQFLGLVSILLGRHTNKIDSFEQIVHNYAQYYKIDDNGHITGIFITYPEGPFIGVIPKQINNLEYLEELYLFNQNIKIIPKEIVKLKSLRILKLINNPLIEIPNFIMNLSSSGKLEIEDKLHGFCSFKWEKEDI